MTASEYQRHRVFQWFEDAMGPELSEAFMEVIPPVTWNDAATKTELQTGLSDLELNLRTEMAGMEARLTSQISTHMRTLFLGMMASNATFAGLVLAAVKLG